MNTQVFKAISSAIKSARLNGAMSTRVSLETTFVLEQMFEEGAQIDSWELEGGYLTVVSNGKSITL